MVAESLSIARKDLVIEVRSKAGLWQVVPFAVAVLIIFGFALDPDRGVLTRASAGLFWVAVLLSTLLVVQRSFAAEASDGGLEALRSTGVDPMAIFAGKAAAIAVQLIVLQLVLAAGVYVFFDAPLAGMPLLLVIGGVSTVCLASTGAIYGMLSAAGRGRETLLPLLFLPVAAPVLLAATRASEAAMAGVYAEAWPWLQVLAVFAIVYSAAGSVAFGPLLEDAV